MVLFSEEQRQRDIVGERMVIVNIKVYKNYLLLGIGYNNEVHLILLSPL